MRVLFRSESGRALLMQPPGSDKMGKMRRTFARREGMGRLQLALFGPPGEQVEVARQFGRRRAVPRLPGLARGAFEGGPIAGTTGLSSAKRRVGETVVRTSESRWLPH